MLDELIGTPGVREELRLASAIGVMALHGGLEPGTAEAAGEVADATGASRYAIVQPDNLFWHIPSIHHDPSLSEQLRLFLDHVSVAVSFHGFGRDGMGDTVLLGGSNRELASRIGEAISLRSSLRVITELDDIPSVLRGLHPKNPVNLPERGGVQLELSPGARTPRYLPMVIQAVAAVVGTTPSE